MLSVAGSDPSGGAGIQADLKTFAAFGVEGCAIPVALTVQNSRGVARVHAVPAELVAEQLEAVLSDMDVRAVKIGMLANASIVETVADAVRRHRPPFVVLDPVIRSTSGASLLDDEGVEMLRTHLLPLATLVTPNAAEAGALLRGPSPSSVADAHAAARKLHALGAQYVLVTGGHLGGEREVVDVLADESGTTELRVDRVMVSRTHGTGCRLSSAVAALVALGESMAGACAKGQRFVAEWLAAEESAKRSTDQRKRD